MVITGVLLSVAILCARVARVVGDAYTAVGRLGHSAVLVNDSMYLYGGDTSISSATDAPRWISDMAILPINIPYSLTDPPWKPASGPQNTVGGPVVYSHVAFVGGPNGGNMIVLGGVMPDTNENATEEDRTAYSYDCDIGRWNTFSLPDSSYLNRQGAAVAAASNGVAYIWGGKYTATGQNKMAAKQTLSTDMYRIDSLFPSNSSKVSVSSPAPALRYAHTQTMVGHSVVVLGGFDGSTGDAVSMADVWVYNTLENHWSQITAQLDKENKPANRSSHSQVLMPDGVSIVIYGGYDGYHVFNDVAVLDTRTWSWTVKNTNAAVQGRADHTATLVGSNMVVAFGFTGVSTALTVMSDIEVLDILTWSWTSTYTPSSSYALGGGQNNGFGQGRTTAILPSTPSMAIVAGAVTGGLVVFVLIIVALYIFNYHHQKQNKQQRLHRHHPSDRHPPSSSSAPQRSDLSGEMSDMRPTKDEDLWDEPDRHAHRQPVHLQTRTDMIRAPPVLPSPWSKQASFVRRAATTPANHSKISKPDEPSYGSKLWIRRAATTATATSTNTETTIAGPSKPPSPKPGCPSQDELSEADEDGFDRQEFILRSDEMSSDGQEAISIQDAKPAKGITGPETVDRTER